MLLLALVWLAGESYHYYNFRRRTSYLRSLRFTRRPECDQWAQQADAHLTDLPYHQRLAEEKIAYRQGKPVIFPLYKPLAVSLFLRGAYLVCTAIARLAGWRRERRYGLTFWCKGHGEPLLFLHGFGFGVFPYLYWLNHATSQYRVIAPEFPAICFDGSTVISSIADYSRQLLCYLQGERFYVASNSYGTFVQSCLLTLVPEQISGQLFIEPVCFYPYYATVTNFVESRLIGSRDWRHFLLQLACYLLIAKDPNILALCQQSQFELYWEAERTLATIPTTIVLSGEDYIVASRQLHRYFQHRYPQCRVLLLEGVYHGTAVFSGRIDEILTTPPLIK